MVNRLPNAQHSWRVRTAQIADVEDAKVRAQCFERRHPGLEWTGRWGPSPLGNCSEIEVRSTGPFVASLGPTSSHSDAVKKTDEYLHKHPYLKWIADCSHTGWLKNFRIKVEASQPADWLEHGGERAVCLPVTTKIRMRNLTSEVVTRISVRDIDDNDWGARNPDNQLSGSHIDKHSLLEKELDVNFWSDSATLTVWLALQSGRWLRFRVNHRVAIDSEGSSQWNYSSGQGLAAYHLLEPGSQLLEIVACVS